MENIQHTLLRYGRKDKAAGMKAYMKDQFTFYGVQAVLRRRLTQSFVREIKKWPKEDVFLMVDELWKAEHRECQYVAMDILDKITGSISEEDLTSVKHWILTKSWWDTVDHLASHQVGHLFRNRALRDITLPRWLSGDNIWLNRCCLLYQLMYKADTDWEGLKQSVEVLRNKDEFFIQKAIGWALRQYSKTDPNAVKQYIENSELSNLACREGLKWLARNAK